ncbi:MAG: virulence RhuM family protein [Clostridiales bacterium]|nr:virulence RhuM family protein [Clostridiales bacterium]
MDKDSLQYQLYRLDDDNEINAVIKDETIWLTQKSMSEVFDVGVPAISKHLGNIFESGELDEDVVVSNLEITTQHGALPDKTQTKEAKFYSLDAIISVGYRVNSLKATRFRQWATRVLRGRTVLLAITREMCENLYIS